MNERPTPFALVFGHLAPERFPAIADALAAGAALAADRDAFVLLQPVGALLRELVPAEAPAAALEAYVRLLHHAYRHWEAGGWVYRVSDAALDRAVERGAITAQLPRSALYLQLPAHRVWRAPAADEPPEPLDGMFVTATGAATIAVLGISGMHRNRPGFSAVSVDGRADADDPTGDELLVAAARDDGSAPFASLLVAESNARLYSLANAGELLLLTCRLLAALPASDATGLAAEPVNGERFLP